MLFQATLTKITDFKQLIFEISETTYVKLCCSIDRKNIWTFETEDSEGNPTERYYAKILLDRFDKAIIEKKFDNMVKKVCMVTANVETFTPPDSEDELKFLRLKKCFPLKQQPSFILRRRPAQLTYDEILKKMSFDYAAEMRKIIPALLRSPGCQDVSCFERAELELIARAMSKGVFDGHQSDLTKEEWALCQKIADMAHSDDDELSPEMEAAAQEGHDEAHRVKLTEEEEAIAEEAIAEESFSAKLDKVMAGGRRRFLDEHTDAGRDMDPRVKLIQDKLIQGDGYVLTEEERKILVERPIKYWVPSSSTMSVNSTLLSETAPPSPPALVRQNGVTYNA